MPQKETNEDYNKLYLEVRDRNGLWLLLAKTLEVEIDKPLALAAVEQNPNAMQYVPLELQQDPDIISAALRTKKEIKPHATITPLPWQDRTFQEPNKAGNIPHESSDWNKSYTFVFKTFAFCAAFSLAAAAVGVLMLAGAISAPFAVAATMASLGVASAGFFMHQAYKNFSAPTTEQQPGETSLVQASCSI